MNYQQLAYFLDRNWVKSILRAPISEYPFDEARALLERIGDPRSGMRFVGVTGSKGKGSIGVLTSAILQQHGVRSGLFSSPHLLAVEERIRIDGETIDREELAERFSRLLDLAQSMGLSHLGIFALLLTVGLEHFRERGARAAVLEVRSGGRFDPTAVVEADVVCIGPIGLEHVPGLGYSEAEIAWQKVGLVKRGALCCSAVQSNEAADVIRSSCAELDVRLLEAGRELHFTIHERDERGQQVSLEGPSFRLEGASLSLLGRHQAENALLALAAASALLERLGIPLSEPAARRALEQTRWPARLERLVKSPPLLFDGAHTLESARALAAALGDHFPGQRWGLVVGLLGSKRAEPFLKELAPIARRLWCVAVPGFEAHPADALAACARRLGLEAESAGSVGVALAEALADGGPVCVTGSLYLYGETRSTLQEMAASAGSRPAETSGADF